MYSSSCCFSTCIQISQETRKVVWYSHLLKNFPQFVLIYTVREFGVINKAEVDVFFWNFVAFLTIQWMLEIWSLVPLPSLNPAWTSASSQFTYCWSLAWRILSITLLACEMSEVVPQFEHSSALHLMEKSNEIFGQSNFIWLYIYIWYIYIGLAKRILYIHMYIFTYIYISFFSLFQVFTRYWI